MDNFSARQAHDALPDIGRLPDQHHRFDLNADDNLGDEAAFPSAWQALAPELPND